MPQAFERKRLRDKIRILIGERILKNRICVIFTGGTIGSSVRNDTVDLDRTNASLLINEYKKHYGESITFDRLYPVDMLSENVQQSDLEKIADCIKNVDCSLYDGIIVTHGTDTLCFTANCFSQMFCGFELPVVLVSASYPLDDERSNGLSNFAGAVTFISEAHTSGVFVSFTNPNEKCKIHLASRLTDAEQVGGRFDSLLGLCFGTVENGAFVRNPDSRNPETEELNAVKKNGRDLKLCNDIVTIKARALLDFTFYTFEKIRPKAVILKLYHSGTICTVGEDTNAVSFIKHCRDLGIEVILSPVASKANVYAGMKNITDNCIKAYDMSFEMTVAKVMLALGSGIPVKQMLDENNFFEKIS